MENTAIIVGAGYAGISTARALHNAGKKFMILEARDRPGGRIHTHSINDDLYIDLGGQWIGPSQDRIYEWAKLTNTPLFETYNDGKNIIALRQQISTYTGLIPKIAPLSLISIDLAIKKLEKMARSINLVQPWLSKNAHRYDAVSLEYWLGKNTYTRAAYQVLRAGLETVLACSPSEVSLLHLLFYIRSGRDLNTLISIENGAQLHRFEGGAQRPLNVVVEQLPAQSLRLSCPVKGISQYESHVVVHSEQGDFTAATAVVAIPPTLASHIHYFPALPHRRIQLMQRIPMGHVVKCYAIYKKPFWRDAGFSGQSLADAESSLLQCTFDNSPHNAQYGILMGFSIAERARRLMDMPENERRQSVLHTLSQYFGSEALSPQYYLDKSWAEESWSGGCYTGIMPTGAWTQFGSALREPCGRILWAGTETSEYWNGYIEGAIRSGEKAAAMAMSF
jgi:monoamine oxidase